MCNLSRSRACAQVLRIAIEFEIDMHTRSIARPRMSVATKKKHVILPWPHYYSYFVASATTIHIFRVFKYSLSLQMNRLSSEKKKKKETPRGGAVLVLTVVPVPVPQI